ncbi:MAG: hypothetical protein IJT49_04370 [Clostridia bacterium]|nr:hypothetical protein [Clostridia bacterium]
MKSADGFSYPVHSHTSYEILAVTKGKCGMIIGDTEYEFGKNDAASRCGFYDYSVFCKSFVKHFKISPSSVKNNRDIPS